ncbi:MULTISPECIES: CRISPR-associated protein Csx19 [unclassified Frankia]|uniref:type III-D CRISPR-associated protein Csx19 n=1 Tax=unclassified Frankia TaxID=2632575 RepID=UPI002AD335DF|nr:MULTISPECIES: CRISPR-associated protein Csx19 [unclassified Frankia]
MTADTSTTLYSATSEKVTLADAIRLTGLGADLGDAVALLASPKRYTVARLSGGRLTDSEKTVELPAAGSAAVFEARIFNRDAELRWLHTGNGVGTAVILAESPDPCARLAEALPRLDAVETIENKYLLWGRPLPAGDDGRTGTGGPRWVRLAEARIGLLDVPLPRAPRPDECAYLRTVEYVTTEPEHGNAGVTEERLVELFLAVPRRSDATTNAGTQSRPHAEASR